MQPSNQPIAVGKRDVKVTLPAHVRGVHEGNQPGLFDVVGSRLRKFLTEARRSTGINLSARMPIDPSSPPLFPA
jgi:hypothetical protein